MAAMGVAKGCFWLFISACIAARSFGQTLPAATMKTDDAPRRLRIVLIGDSTVCDYPEKDVNRGWGQFVLERFRKGSVEVVNLAAPGRSTKTFIQEGRWQKTLAQKPDVILIQFGHNDSHARSKPESTDAATDYRDYLRRYIDDARAASASPILVTPMVRRTFDDNGKIAERPEVGNLLPYVEAMKAVGSEKGVPVIDLYAASKALMEKMGPDASAALASKKGDVTHFNEAGARTMADLVLRQLPVAEPKLKDCLAQP